MGQGGENIIFISSPVFEQLSSMFVVQGDIQSSVGSANEVQKWVEERRRTIPQKLKNDLDIFFSKETFIGMSMIRYAYENNCYESVPNFIHQLESEEPYHLFMRFLQTGFTPDEVSNIQDIQEVSHFIKQTNLPESEKWKLTYLYVDIENTKQRFVNLIKQYYEFYFKDDIPYFLKKQQESIADLYDKQQDLTRAKVGNIFPVIPSHVLENKEIKLILSPSFFYDTASLTSDSDDSFIYHFGMNEMKKNKMSQDDVLDAIKVVADEKRIKIIQLLNKSPKYGYELANTLNLSNSTISHHLSTLSSIGIVFSTRIENKVYYQLHKEKLQVLMETLTKALLD